MSWNPDASSGDRSPWYASFWEFCSLFYQERFETNWSLSPDQSLQLHAEKNMTAGAVLSEIYSPVEQPPTNTTLSAKSPKYSTASSNMAIFGLVLLSIRFQPLDQFFRNFSITSGDFVNGSKKL